MDSELGTSLVRLARGAIGLQFGLSVEAVSEHAALAEPGATFVTLMQHREVRGCVGSLEALRPLAEDVQKNALGAAFRDSRFSPLTLKEFDITSIEVSLLSKSEALLVASEDELLRRIRPGVDGLILEYGLNRATFLPQVWERLPKPRRFLSELKRKAGLPKDFWSEELNVSRYQVTKWKESELFSLSTRSQ